MKSVLVILDKHVILNAVKNLGVIISLLFFFGTNPVLASSTTSRLTLPLTTNSTLVISTTDSTVDKKIIISDHLSSTRVILNEDGTESSSLSYYPYGEQFSNLAIEQFNNRYYTGQRKVPGDNLYNYNARFYNPTLGVFTQPDTVEGPNRFAYVSGNPITFADKSGNDKLDLTMISGRQNNIHPITATGFYDPDHVDKDIPKSLAYGALAFSGGALALAAVPALAVGAFELCVGGPVTCGTVTAFVAEMALGDALPPGASLNPASAFKGVVSGTMERFMADESGQMLPLLGRTSNELADVSDELVASWGAPRMARLKAPADFRDDIVKIFKGESPAVVYADTGRPISIPQKAIDLISSRLGPKGLRDQRLMRELADTIYQLSQDPHHPGLRSHKIPRLDFTSSSINGDWRLAWDWIKINVLTISGELEEVGAIRLLSVGQHSGTNAIY
ncbi:hypothetical protein A3D80_01560 [Candidatus Roizmanbacteria bacterium RIFCSPHIGHO2_02_FULL_40_13b]|uniref:RHS repeat-associated core domain-containing protein n=1 Tax=Candidatus Roizmanbacteria bacterium RIFCSPHIGHO2_01_FULL_39_24 TaxID=1802032 RepID=A0A1F7GF75_9BACT|nr:MAG: hypothetical protein A2799_00875 [Candidatus Roizmanbacteria bacterium RIFCSPHIGHO2_01_FULL_39_24]OGK26812.1 MAG: hypothetical protein A3D80_01560 [Candidatus Roizmanbacteria bacterium RIFCSPHIGHO2_02_FULL_40_13b]OGK48735.1 MAG: hypothetical protein A3A56_03095 [Candidatus Roizmanbacteria bacterium RIFCSPLOWO2_01_FULL_40_32]